MGRGGSEEKVFCGQGEMPVITAATDVILIVISLDIRPYEACKVLPSPNITEGDIINSFFIQGGMIPGNPTFPSSFNSIVNSSGLPYILLISCRFFSTQLVTKNGSFLMSSGVTKYHIQLFQSISRSAWVSF